MKPIVKKNGIKIILILLLLLIVFFSIKSIKSTDRLSQVFYNSEPEVEIPAEAVAMNFFLQQHDTSINSKIILQVYERQTPDALVIKLFGKGKLIDSLQLVYTNDTLKVETLKNANPFLKKTKLDLLFGSANKWDLAKYKSKTIIEKLNWNDIKPDEKYDSKRKINSLPAKAFFAQILKNKYRAQNPKKDYLLLIYKPKTNGTFAKDDFKTLFVNKQEVIDQYSNYLKQQRDNLSKNNHSGVFDLVRKGENYKIVEKGKKQLSSKKTLGKKLPQSLFNFFSLLENRTLDRTKTRYKAFNYISYLNLSVPGGKWKEYFEKHKNDKFEDFIAGALLLQMDTWKKDKLHLEYGKDKNGQTFISISSGKIFNPAWIVLVLSLLGIVLILLDGITKNKLIVQKEKIQNNQWTNYLSGLIQTQENEGIKQKLLAYKDNHDYLQQCLDIKRKGNEDVVKLIEKGNLEEALKQKNDSIKKLNSKLEKITKAKSIEELNQLGVNIENPVEQLDSNDNFEGFYQKLVNLYKNYATELNNLKLDAGKYRQLEKLTDIVSLKDNISNKTLVAKLDELLKFATAYKDILSMSKWNDLKQNKELFNKLNALRPDKTLLEEKDFDKFYDLLTVSYSQYSDKLKQYKEVSQFLSQNNLDRNELKDMLIKLKAINKKPYEAFNIIYNEIYLKITNAERLGDIKELLNEFSKIDYEENLQYLLKLENTGSLKVDKILNKIIENGINSDNVDSFFNSYKLQKQFMSKLPGLIDEVWDSLEEVELNNPVVFEPEQIINLMKFYNIMRDYERTYRKGNDMHYKKYKANVFKLIGDEETAKNLVEKFDVVNGIYSHQVKIMYFYIGEHLNAYKGKIDFYIDGTDFSEYFENLKK